MLSNCKFSQNMNITDKYRIASDLANAIKKLGYKAEIGYQTFLYFNEKESRRLFLFLFDKLSKQKQDEPKNLTNKGLLNRLKSIEIDFDQVKETEKDVNCLKWRTDKGVYYLNYLMKNRQTNNWVPFDNPSLFIEWNSLNLNTNSKLFSNFYHNLVLNKDLIDFNALNDKKSSDSYSTSKFASSKAETVFLNTEQNSNKHTKQLNEHLNKLEEQLNLNKKKLAIKKEALELKKENLKSLIVKFDEKKLELDKVKYSEKSNEELKDGIEKMKIDIKETNKKWQLFNLEYEQSIGELKDKKKLVISEFDEINDEILSTKQQIEINSLKLKKIDESIIELEQNIVDDNELDRKFYTKRIFEIIKNVKKQEEDIDKILIDVRNLQREINQLTGKVSRTYTVVEETIFKNSNLTDWSKRCYKLINDLDGIYDKLISEIELCGQTRREILRLEEIVSMIVVLYE